MCFISWIHSGPVRDGFGAARNARFERRFEHGGLDNRRRRVSLAALLALRLRQLLGLLQRLFAGE
jgi:hypothetical protein